MKNLKTLMVCGLMLLPSLSNAQSCCQGKKEVKKCAKQEHVSSCGKTSCCEKTVAPTAAPDEAPAVKPRDESKIEFIK